MIQKKQTIYTVTKDGEMKHPIFARFNHDERGVPTTPKTWDEPTYTINRRVINHENPDRLDRGVNTYEVPLHKVRAMGLEHKIKP